MEKNDKILLRMALRHARDMIEALSGGNIYGSGDEKLKDMYRTLADYCWTLTQEIEEAL